MTDDEKEINEVREKNKPIVDGFTTCLENSGLSSKVIKSHIDNVAFFEEYLVYYEPYQSLCEFSAHDVDDFLGNFFPRKAMWACPSNVKSYIATFKRLFKYLIKLNIVTKDEYEELLETIKEEKEDWLASVALDDEY